MLCSLNTSPGVASCTKKSSPKGTPLSSLRPLIFKELAESTRNHGAELVASSGAAISCPDLHPRTTPPALGLACTPLCYFWGASQPSLSTVMLKPSHLLILGLGGEGNSTSLSLVPLPTQSRSEQTRQALVPVGAAKL